MVEHPLCLFSAVHPPARDTKSCLTSPVSGFRQVVFCSTAMEREGFCFLMVMVTKLWPTPCARTLAEGPSAGAE